MGFWETCLGSSLTEPLTSVMHAEICKECFTHCQSHQECLKMQEFNIIVENARAVAKLKKHIVNTVPEFKGRTAWLKANGIQEKYTELDFKEHQISSYYRFMTFTFDPKKFSFNELTQPELLDNYIKHCIYNLRYLFKGNSPVLVREFHKSGIPHYHMLYNTSTPLEQYTIILRMRYYLSHSLKNKRSVHDRQANEYAERYISKSSKTYFIIKDFNIKPTADRGTVEL